MYGVGRGATTVIKTRAHNTPRRYVYYIILCGGFLCRARIIIIIIITITSAREKGSRTGRGGDAILRDRFCSTVPGGRALRVHGRRRLIRYSRARPGHSITAMGFSVSFQSDRRRRADTLSPHAITAGSSFSRRARCILIASRANASAHPLPPPPQFPPSSTLWRRRRGVYYYFALRRGEYSERAYSYYNI